MLEGRLLLALLLLAGGVIGALPACTRAVSCPEAELARPQGERALAWAVYECERVARLRDLGSW